LCRAFCFCANAADIRVACPCTTAQAARMDKLQRAGRAFLWYLVTRHGLDGAARVLRALADEIDGLAGSRRLRVTASRSPLFTIGSKLV
jgi:hypothetical protein